ncbi:hypothetical protein CBS101457_006551 [Exobasidium rhododendri]|nr:hypothetical protein CBS101457_006551 [Exobasidium rhododendri]
MILSSLRRPICAACRSDALYAHARALSSSASSSSGSNKWSKIKHKKAANDAAKSNMYGALSREIIASVRNHPTHSTSPETNSRLAMLLKKAKELEVTREKIEMTLKKAENAGTSGSSVSYEALGPPTKDGTPVAMIIECQTDSTTRTMARVKEAINKHNARLSSTSHLFQRTGVIRLSIGKGLTFDNVWEAAVENGAEDVRQWESDEEEGTGVEVRRRRQVICNPSDLNALGSVLSSPPHSHTIIEAEAKMIASGPLLQIRGEDEGTGEEGITAWLEEEELAQLDNLVAALEESADCQRVWSNVDGWPA